MRFRRSTKHLNTIARSLAAVTVSASALFAQGRPLFNWSGRVDREVRITMRGRDARTVTGGRVPMQRSRLDVATALPQRDGRVSVRVQDGRGDVDVVQQPSARNDYTAIVRIVDRSNGADRYRLTAFWMPDESRRRDDRWDDRNGYPDRPGRNDRNDRDDRRDRNDRDDRYGRGNGNGGWGNSGGYGGSSYARSALRWSGDVDDALEIRIQGDRISYRTVSGKSVRNVRADLLNGGLPRRDVDVVVTSQYGRGSVSVVQQPSAYNGYTAVIRVYDPRPSYGNYAFDIGWRDGYRGRR